MKKRSASGQSANGPTVDGSGLPLGAAITAGGQSRRFGQDKALYVLDGQSLLQRVAASLHPCSPRLLIAPAGRYTLPGWQQVPDHRPGQGPLAGLESALGALLHLRPAGGWLAFSAVDLPHLSPAYWALLAARCEAGAEAVLGTDDGGRPQPLAACYHTSALGTVSALLDRAERRMSALTAALPVRRVEWNDVAAVSPRVYLNLNTRPEPL